MRAPIGGPKKAKATNVMTGHEIEEPTSPPPPSAPAPPSHVPWWKIWQKPPEIVLVIATAVLAAATIILAAIAGIQAYILATTDVSTRKVADVAESAAGTAKATLEASRQSFRQDERAYLWASSFNMSNPPVCQFPGGTRICADVHIVNSGRTPAIGVQIHRYATSGAPFSTDVEAVIKAMKVPPYTSPTGDMLGSVGDKWGTAATDVLDEATAKEILDGKTSLYVYGVVQYFDIFNEYHETGFCSYRILNNGPFMACDYGNWFDKRPK